ncbi:MAG: hypothetical protein KJ795_00195 [Gammaproteobacteria bacterium]|nr:hypothetical protein [Gammaproteobacteria bacterium]MBU1777943.1 hypothetical protein [Gammaproteobacteria bacterium]
MADYREESLKGVIDSRHGKLGKYGYKVGGVLKPERHLFTIRKGADNAAPLPDFIC